jgi:rhodanese-related sulfurtransferase
MAIRLEELVSKAKAKIKPYSAEQAMQARSRNDVVFVDVRDEPELRASGKVKNALHVSRGMLEFHIDPKAPYHDPVFASDKEFIFYCKSGGRSALAAERAIEMGCARVGHIEGGFPAWEKAGGPTERL